MTTPIRSWGRGNLLIFGYLSTWAYLLYAIGNATPYLRTDLRLTDFEAGLHASALAIGNLSAGFAADWIGRRVGSRQLMNLAVSILIGGIAFVVLAPVLPVSLLGAFSLGLGGGTLGTKINVDLQRSAGSDSRLLMSQANALAMMAAASAPLVMGVMASTFQAWRAAMLLPLGVFAALTLIRRRQPKPAEIVHPKHMGLPSSYWFAWLFLVLGVSIEFCFVFWGSTMATRRTGMPNADATILASLFVVGMLVSRLLLSAGLAGARSSRTVLAGGLLVILAGGSLVWVSPIPAGTGVGLFVGGFGTGVLWPVGVAVALQQAGAAQLEGSARATLASGVAVFFAPSALGLAADAAGVVAAWAIILGLAVAALIVVIVTPSPAPVEEALAAPA